VRTRGRSSRHDTGRAGRDHGHAPFSLSVADVDRSMAFYREFGFEPSLIGRSDGDYVE
jgi:hypothetical protein